MTSNFFPPNAVCCDGMIACYAHQLSNHSPTIEATQPGLQTPARAFRIRCLSRPSSRQILDTIASTTPRLLLPSRRSTDSLGRTGLPNTIDPTAIRCRSGCARSYICTHEQISSKRSGEIHTSAMIAPPAFQGQGGHN